MSRMQIYLSLAVCIIGLVVYALAGPKPAELGRIAFAVGLLVFLFTFAGHVLRG